MKLFTRSSVFMALALAAMVATTTSAHAASIGVVTTSQGQLGGTGAATGFATNPGGYNFAFTSISTTQTPGAVSTCCGNVAMDTATVAAFNGCTTPDCGIIALDADFTGNVAAVTYTLTGLSVGTTYDLGYAVSETQQLWSSLTSGAPLGSCQPSGTTFCDTPFEAGLTASGAGGTSILYAPATMTQQTASSWTTETFAFVAGSSSEVVTFMPTSTTSGNVPSFALLDDLTLSAVTPPPPGVPEPSSLLLLSTGLLGLGGYMRMRLKSGAATKA